MKQANRFLVTTSLLVLFSVASAATLNLKAGQSGVLGDKKVTILSIQDNRCRTDVRCFRAGELIVKILVSSGNKIKMLSMQYPELPNTTRQGVWIKEAPYKTTYDKTPLVITFSDEQ